MTGFSTIDQLKLVDYNSLLLLSVFIHFGYMMVQPHPNSLLEKEKQLVFEKYLHKKLSVFCNKVYLPRAGSFPLVKSLFIKFFVS